MFLNKSRNEDRIKLSISDALPEVSRDYTKKI